MHERATLCEKCGEPVLDLHSSPSSGSMFLTGGRTAKRLISDLVPGEVLKAMLRPMPPRPHARVTIATWVDRKSWSTAVKETVPPRPPHGPPSAAPISPPVAELEPIIDSVLLVEESVRPQLDGRTQHMSCISDLACDEPASHGRPALVRVAPRGAPIASLGS